MQEDTGGCNWRQEDRRREEGTIQQEEERRRVHRDSEWFSRAGEDREGGGRHGFEEGKIKLKRAIR